MSYRRSLIHHLEVNVSDLQTAFDFWGWFLGLLGCQPYQSFNNGFSYIFGESYVVFIQTEDEQIQHGYDRRNIGLNHIAFHAVDFAEVDMIRDRLIERGVPILKYTKDMNDDPNYCLSFEAPDGVLVELLIGKEVMDLEKIEAQTNGGYVEATFEGEELQIYLNGQLRTTMTFDNVNTVTVNHHRSEE